MKPEEYPTAGIDWEMRRLGDFGLSPNLRGRKEDCPIIDSESPIAISNFNAVGGSTILYAAHFPRFHPRDFKTKTFDGVGEDWPVDYARLAPYYDLNARMMGVAGLAGDPAYPPHDFPLPPVPMGKVGETLARGFNKLGWHWRPSGSGERVSRIVPTLAPGTPVTVPRTYVDHVVTEHGIAELRGKTVKERVRALQEIAHPNFRDQLRDRGRELYGT
jgi:choline dehydrogenase-like flavoprotein